jgi:hypothetical protein
MHYLGAIVNSFLFLIFQRLCRGQKAPDDKELQLQRAAHMLPQIRPDVYGFAYPFGATVPMVPCLTSGRLRRRQRA